MDLSCFFLKDLLSLFFLLERQIYREERQRGRSSVRWFTLQVSYANPKPGASSGSPTRVQCPKALGCPRLLLQDTGSELEGKRGCWDRTGAHMGSRTCNARTLTTAPLPGSDLSSFFKDLFIYIAKSDIERGGESERNIFRLSSDSLPKWPKWPALCRSKPGARSSPRSPTLVQDPKALGCPQLLSRATGRELEGKRGCRDFAGIEPAPIWDPWRARQGS